MEKYVHPELNFPVELFSGAYVLVEEGKVNYQGKEVLYLLGFAGVEASCCGRGGWAFIKVPGYLCSRRKSFNEAGQPVSYIERINDEGSQREIRKILKEKYPAFAQVEFF
jgi:hypothetical protein